MDTISHTSDRACPDSGIETNYSGTSDTSSVLLDNVTTAETETNNSTSETTTLEHDLSEVHRTTPEDDIQDKHDRKRISKRISSDSGGSAFEFIDVPLSLEDDTPAFPPNPSSFHSETFTTRKACPPANLDLPKNCYSSQTAATKSHEMDLLEERDTFSPVSTGYSSDQLADDACSSIDFIPDVVSTVNGGDNKNFEKKKGKATSTKEEKQRQNEEIVIMETSSISSETGSWESVFPHRTNVEVKDCCRNFLHNERRNSSQCTAGNVIAQSTEPTDIIQLDRSDIITHPSSSSVTACFIDASTLLDDSEMVYPSLGPKLPEGGCFSPRPSEEGKSSATQNSDKSEDSEKDAWPKKMHLDKLESFHKSFELCKKKPMIQSATQATSTSSSSYSDESPQKSGESTNNLSDEEKLWKRENSMQSSNGRIEVKDQYNKPSPNGYKDIFNSPTRDTDTILTRQGTFDMDESERMQLRKDQERKQGNLVFQNSIQQFSGHLISPKMTFPANEFVEYSASSSSIPTWTESDKSNGAYYASNGGNDLGGATDEADVGKFRKSRTQSESETSATGTCVLPDTPHNSIVQIDPALKANDKDASTSNLDSESPVGIKIPKRTLRCDESIPIVSGGASIKDFTPKQCESPPVRRKTETCPIVSGGFHSLDYEAEDETKVKTKDKSKSNQSSWVVDMSDCKSRRRRSTSSSSSTENTARSADVSSERGGSGGSRKNGMGFYVSLNDIEPPKPSFDADSTPIAKLSRSLHESVKKSTGFYVDLSESENSRNATPPPTANNQTPPINGDKKNIFSMFIDFGEKKPIPKREPLSLASRLSSSLHQKRDSDIMKTSSSSTETLLSRSTHNQGNVDKLDSAGETLVGSSDESRKHSLMAENDTPPPVIRRIQQRNIQKDESKRHSWNPQSSSQSGQNPRKEHKRSASLTGDKGIMNILDKIPLISKTSSMSIDSSLSPFEDFTCSKSELSTYSNNSQSGTSVSVHSSFGEADNLSKKLKKRRRDVQINETFDKSSQGSLTDGVFSKDLSPASTTDTEDLTFQQEENLCIVQDVVAVKENVRPPIMETIIETKEMASPKKEPKKSKSSDVKSPAHTMETLHATIEKQKQLLETVNEHASESSTNFVKLSDMDKPFTKFELHSPDTMSKSVGNHRHISRLFQETRSRPHSWAMTRSTGNTILNITSSVENLRSLTRLFPHLSKEFSNSLPGDFALEISNRRSPNEMDYMQSDLSADSSLASSISRSGMDESSISCRQPRRLGEDLLKMFLQEIATDVIVEVNGRRIKAHKCILKSRCQYFAAVLAGGWVQSAGNVISLPGYSYSSVHFALCHIYSGASHPPEGISLMELAALADYLGLEGLKEVTGHALKMNYCHNFHKPCSGCIDGILQVLPVALNHALDDLYRKCLKWSCRHYLKVWPTRSFAQLPSDIQGRCRQQIVAHLSSETVLETILDCDDIIAQIAPCRWATSIENMIRDIMDTAYVYVSDHFASLIASDSFLSLGHDKSSNISRLEGILLRTASSLTPDQACRSYQRVTRLNAVLAAKVIKVPNVGEHAREFGEGVHEEEMDWNEEFIRLVSAILSAVEQCLTRQCARAMRVTAWQRMDLELRKKIQKLACLTEPLDMRRGKPVVKAFSFNTTGSRNQDLYQVKLAIQAHSKRALAQDTQLYRATAHTQTQNRNIQTIEKGVQANNETKEISGRVFKSSSKTNVPATQPPALQPTHRPKTEKPTVLSHRRTQSEDSSTSQKLSDVSGHKSNSSSSNVRLADVRPRYLEPRKPRGPLKSQTSSNIPSTMRGKAISSSDSSRTPSPATSKRIAGNVARKLGPKSINMSLDSLASPSKKANTLKGVRVDTEISVDSLADSMKSSIKTEKTISQESLSNAKFSRSNPIINKENQAVKQSVAKNPKNKSLSCQNTSGSSPSSITNKSSRLSSTTSSMNSPRDAFKNRSISVPAGQSTARKSFLSAKSREILARKSAALAAMASNQSNGSSSGGDSTTTKHQQTNILQDKIISVNKSSSSSNIPMRKASSQTTSSQLKKTSKMASNISPVKSTSSGRTAMNNTKTGRTDGIRNGNGHQSKNERISSKKIGSSTAAVDNKRDNHQEIQLVIESPKEIRIESKLERSSTFCKEVPDLPVSELQIID